jgi:signal peptidase II
MALRTTLPALYKFFLLSAAIILLDHTVKLLVHFQMPLGLPGQIKVLGDWFKLHYTLNPGMAFGIELGSEYGKLLLTGFRLLAAAGIVWYMIHLYRAGHHQGMIWCLSLILGGAIGNLIDSIFYGVLLDNAPYGTTSAWFHGQVIDMFYIDIWEGMLPYWIPLIGGEYYSFWPIFNVADASIFVGVALMLLYQNKFFPAQDQKKLSTES